MKGFTFVGLALAGAIVVSANAPTTATIDDEGVPPKASVASTPTEVGMVHPVAVLMDNGDVVPIPTMAPEYADEEMYGDEYPDGDMAMHFDPYGENTPFPVGEMGPDGIPIGEEAMVDDEESAAQRSMFAKRGYGGYGGGYAAGYGGGYGGYGRGYGAVYGAGYGNVYPTTVTTIDRYGKWGKRGPFRKWGKKYGGYNQAQFYRRGPLLNKPIINTPIINKPVINKPIVNRPIFNKPSYPFIPTPLPTLPTLPVEPPVQLPVIPPVQLPVIPPMPQIPVNYPSTIDVQPAYTYPSYDAVYGQPDCPPGQSCGGVVTPMYMPRKTVVTSGGYTRPSYSKYVH